MRYLALISTLLTLNAALQVAAAPAPARATQVVPLPVLGGFTLGMITPTNIPNVMLPGLPAGAPGVPAAPVKRAWTGYANIGPRFVKNADYEASANQSVPVPTAPAPQSTTTLQRRVTKSKEGHKSGKSAKVAESSGAGSPAPALPVPAGSPQGAAADAGNSVKSLGKAPKQDVSPAFYALPLGSIPDTPVTQADIVGGADAAAPPPPPPPVPEEEVPAGGAVYSNTGYNGYSSTGSGASDFKQGGGADANAAPVQRRHDLVLDTDPLIPPSDGTKTDPRMGLFNLDSNSNPEPHVPVKRPIPDGAPVPVPDPQATGSLDPAYPDVSQPPPPPGPPSPPAST